MGVSMHTGNMVRYVIYSSVRHMSTVRVSIGAMQVGMYFHASMSALVTTGVPGASWLQLAANG